MKEKEDDGMYILENSPQYHCKLCGKEQPSYYIFELELDEENFECCYLCYNKAIVNLIKSTAKTKEDIQL